MLKKTIALAVALAAAGATAAAGAVAAQAATPGAFGGLHLNGFVQSNQLIGGRQADLIALKAVGGGTVVQTQLENEPSPLHYTVDILQPLYEFEVWVNARNGNVMRIYKQPNK